MNMINVIIVMLGLGLVAVPVGAQAPLQTQVNRPIRVVLASAKLPNAVAVPLHLALQKVTLSAGQGNSYLGANGFLYQMSGALVVEVDGEGTNLRTGEAMFLAAGRRAALRAGNSGPAVFLHFQLLPADEPNHGGHSTPASVTQMYRSPAPITGLKPGPHEFSLTQVTSPPHMPPPPMHYRSGTALYYVLSGTGRMHLDNGKAEAKAAGIVQLEPNGVVHTWENTGDAPLVLLQANISQEGAPEIRFLQ
jgi:quercetin dioxygenase-like cupin family protein